MSRHRWIFLVTAAVLCGCVMPQRARKVPALTQPVSVASLSQECSDLRADIASARYRQRTEPATSKAAVIAEAANAKAEQVIEALRQRYESMGCAKAAARSP
jgi:hypothetical protein